MGKQKGIEADMEENLLEVKDLKTYFYMPQGIVPAVDEVSFQVKYGETIGMVGESGCGKSVTALSVMRLISPPGRVESGEIIFEGDDLLKKSEREMRSIRGNKISMIFQEPMTSLNPSFTVGMQIAEVVKLHQKVNHKEAMERAVEALRQVGIPLPERRVKEYPHQLSGGMRQRVMIAMALSCNPSLLIADEPTTALDVTIQAQILDLMKDLKEKLEMALLIITHDFGVIAEMADRVYVVYAGKVVEEAKTTELLQHPSHPYTKGLLSSIPRLESDRKKKLHVIRGVVPDPSSFPRACRFAPRCDYAKEICIKEEPPMQEFASGQRVRCWRGLDRYEDNHAIS